MCPFLGIPYPNKNPTALREATSTISSSNPDGTGSLLYQQLGDICTEAEEGHWTSRNVLFAQSVTALTAEEGDPCYEIRKAMEALIAAHGAGVLPESAKAAE